MSEKIALITGANRGLGFAIAAGMAKLGYKVLIGARDLTKGREAAGKIGGGAEAVGLDVTDASSVQAVAQEIGSRFGHLDVLVNNAGISAGFSQTAADQPLSEIRETMETNFIAPVALTQALLPLLRKSEAGRIVNMSSTLGSQKENDSGSMAQSNFFAYSASKAALNHFTIKLAKELKDTAVKVNSVCPGWCKTDMGGDQAPRSAEQGAAIAIKMATLPADGPTGGFFDDAGTVPW